MQDIPYQPNNGHLKMPGQKSISIIKTIIKITITVWINCISQSIVTIPHHKKQNEF